MKPRRPHNRNNFGSATRNKAGKVVSQARFSEELYIETSKAALSDETPLALTIEIREAWLLVSGLQLATRHLGMSDSMRGALTAIARQFQTAIVQAHPETEMLLEMGWDLNHDGGQSS